jgi:hypothetical protein
VIGREHHDDLRVIRDQRAAGRLTRASERCISALTSRSARCCRSTQRHGRFYRLTRRGKVLSHPVRPLGGSLGFNWPGFHLFGPYDPRISPDGKRIANWLRAQSVGPTNDIFTYTATTSVTHFDSSVRRSAVDQRYPHWIGNHRLTTSDPYGTGRDAILTWVPSGGDDHRQGWFHINDVLAQDGSAECRSHPADVNAP